MTEAVLADWRTAPIDEKLRATLGFIEKVVKTPDALTGADARAVLDAGVTEKALEDALVVTAMFSTINRLADAFGFAVPSAAAFEAGAKSLLRFGYAL